MKTSEADGPRFLRAKLEFVSSVLVTSHQAPGFWRSIEGAHTTSYGQLVDRLFVEKGPGGESHLKDCEIIAAAASIATSELWGSERGR
jgi:hypothetical protein